MDNSKKNLMTRVKKNAKYKIRAPCHVLSHEVSTFIYTKNRDSGWVSIVRLEFGICLFPFFFFFFLHAFVRLRLLFMHCSMNSSHKVWLFNFFQPISTHRTLFMDPQISLFSNFFIKNKFHGIIYTFKNYFATVLFSFQFQFLAVSKRTLYQWR